ncbi:MAG: hypothetical protein QW398_05470 [Desulfurococcaceae archaeon]
MAGRELKMTTGLIRGANAMGHVGWVTVKCSICSRKMNLFRSIDSGEAYVCIKCNNFFCSADAKRLGYKCPYDGSELRPYYA